MRSRDCDVLAKQRQKLRQALDGQDSGPVSHERSHVRLFDSEDGSGLSVTPHSRLEDPGISPMTRHGPDISSIVRPRAVSDIGHSRRVAGAVRSKSPMPRISRFLGITIVMHYDDHPPPHFHVHYGGDGATMDINTMRLTDGYLPPRVLGLVTEWGARNRDVLLDNFDRCLNHQGPVRIPPLE